jgi:hypothetical protein
MELCRFGVENVNKWELPSFPVVFGVPIKQGLLRDGTGFLLRNETGATFTAQGRCLAKHGDGTIRRLLINSELPLFAQSRGEFSLEVTDVADLPMISWDGTRTTGSRVCVAQESDSFLFSCLGQYWRLTFSASVGRDADSGKIPVFFRAAETVLTETGPVSLRLDVMGGMYVGDERLLDVDLVIQVYATTPAIGLDVITTNRSDHRVIRVYGFSARLERLHGEFESRLGIEVRNGPSGDPVELPCSIRTDKLVTSIHREGNEIARRASRLIGYGETWFSRGGRSGHLTVALRNFWESYPYGVSASQDVLEIEFFPAWANPIDLVMGVGKTHEALLAFVEPEEADAYPARSLGYMFGKPPLVQIPLEHRAVAGVLREYLPYLPDTYPRAETNLFDLFQNRIKGFGKLNWGDDFSPLYTNQKRGGEDVVWNNLEGDHPYHAFCQFARTGQFIYMKDLHDSILHWLDVDFADRHHDPRHEGALIAHTRRHVVNGGTTPSHNWAEGFMEWYYMTGDPRVKRVLEQMADWFLRNKDRELRTPPYVRTWGWGLIQLVAIWDVTGRAELPELMAWMVEQLHAFCTENNGLIQGFGETPGSMSVNAFHSATVAIGAYHVYRLTGNETAKSLCIMVTESISDKRATTLEGIPTYVNGPEQDFPMQQAATLTLGAIGVVWEITKNEDLVRRGMRMLEYCLDRGLQLDHMRIPGQFVEFEDGICLMPELVWPNCQLLSYQLRGILLFMKAAHECGFLKKLDYAF